MRTLKKLIAISLAFMPIALVTAASAPLSNPISAPDIQTLLKDILQVVIDIGVPVLVMAIIWVGFMFVKAQGKPEEIKTANNAFLWTVIGAGVVLGAKVISEALKATVDKLK
ncbi:MAG: TrbC/VirB2 family protein [Candidatus Paceibacterota bacterium]|jgi:hypothetical protein